MADGAQSDALAAQLAAAAAPVQDRLRGWGEAAAEQFRADGAADGWDSDASDEETAEQKYMRARPAAPASPCHSPCAGGHACAATASALPGKVHLRCLARSGCSLEALCALIVHPDMRVYVATSVCSATQQHMQQKLLGPGARAMAPAHHTLLALSTLNRWHAMRALVLLPDARPAAGRCTRTCPW